MKLELLPRTDLAVRALRYVALHQGAKSNDIANELGTSFGYLTQILRPLVDAGYLSTTRGPSAGYRLMDSAGRLSMLQIIEIMEGPTDDGTCALRGSDCDPQNPCGLHDGWAFARTALLKSLSGENVLTDLTGA